ncbi:MAG: hypothetical protein ACR2JU_10495 [Nocardioidaceae bacterium]
MSGSTARSWTRVVLEAALPALLPILEHNRDVWVRLTPTRLELSYLWR